MSAVRVNAVVGRDPFAAEAWIKTRAVPEFKDEVRAITNEAAREGSLYAKRFSPHRKGTLRRNIYVKTADKYMPGGRGGGGSWQAGFGVDVLRAPQAVWLLEGTGIYRGLGFVHSLGPHFPSPGAPIRPRHAKAMRFTNAGFRTPIFRKSVLGQKINDDWWYDAIEVARIIVETRLKFMDKRSITST